MNDDIVASSLLLECSSSMGLNSAYRHLAMACHKHGHGFSAQLVILVTLVYAHDSILHLAARKHLREGSRCLCENTQQTSLEIHSRNT